MAETIPDRNIINKFPLSTQHPEISVFNETMERCKANLRPDEHKRVLDLLMQNKDVFSQSKYDIGLTHVIQHKINTGNAAAIKVAPRRIPLAQRKEVEDEIDKMLDNNVIVPSHSMGKPNSCGKKERQLYSSLHRLSKAKSSYGERFIPFAPH